LVYHSACSYFLRLIRLGGFLFLLTTSPSAQPARRILIVEDNALVAKFFRLALERAGGFSCLVSEDVPLLLEEVKAGRADLVLLDISLSEAEWQGQPIGGIALCRLLKRIPRVTFPWFSPPPTS